MLKVHVHKCKVQVYYNRGYKQFKFTTNQKTGLNRNHLITQFLSNISLLVLIGSGCGIVSSMLAYYTYRLGSIPTIAKIISGFYIVTLLSHSDDKPAYGVPDE